jgi:alkanesulfonate monooxygenase
LEEAYRVAELLFPLLPLERAQKEPAKGNLTGPFGEVIANDIVPPASKSRVA